MEVLYQGKQYLAEPWSKQIYFADIHTYLNFENLAWANTQKLKLEKFQGKQKHVLRIMFNLSKTSRSEPFFSV